MHYIPRCCCCLPAVGLSRDFFFGRFAAAGHEFKSCRFFFKGTFVKLLKRNLQLMSREPQFLQGITCFKYSDQSSQRIAYLPVKRTYPPNGKPEKLIFPTAQLDGICWHSSHRFPTAMMFSTFNSGDFDLFAIPGPTSVTVTFFPIEKTRPTSAHRVSWTDLCGWY